MLEKEKYLLIGIAGIFAFAAWWWRSREGRWFHWGDLFAGTILAAWLVVCLGFIHWDFGYVGLVTDACGHPVAYAQVRSLGAAAEGVEAIKRWDSPLHLGQQRTDEDGQYQVKGHLRWSKPFRETPLVWPVVGVHTVSLPRVCSTLIKSQTPGRLSMHIVVELKGSCKVKGPAYYPREKEGLSAAEKAELASAAKLFQHRFKTKAGVEASSEGAEWCEFMELWTRLLSQVGPQALCQAIASEDLQKHLGAEVAQLCH